MLYRIESVAGHPAVIEEIGSVGCLTAFRRSGVQARHVIRLKVIKHPQEE
jgi:hypothetical protein